MAPEANPMCVDDMFDMGLIFGGSVPWEVNNYSFMTMAASEIWKISPSLETIQSVMDKVGAKNVVLTIYFGNPYVKVPSLPEKHYNLIIINYKSL